MLLNWRSSQKGMISFSVLITLIAISIATQLAPPSMLRACSLTSVV